MRNTLDEVKEREAVKGLVSRGILEVRRGAGTYVINTKRYRHRPSGA